MSDILETQFAVYHIAEPFGLFTRAQLLEKFVAKESCDTLRIDCGGPISEPLWPVLERWRKIARDGAKAFVPIYTMEQLSRKAPKLE